MTALRILICVLALACCRCGPECAPLATRCVDNAAEVCNSAGEWQVTLDCDDLPPGEWECCWQPGIPGEPLSEGHTCLTVAECSAIAADGGVE